MIRVSVVRRYAKGKTKRLEANIPVEKSIRVRKDAEAPTVEDFEVEWTSTDYEALHRAFDGVHRSNAEREADRAAGRD